MTESPARKKAVVTSDLDQDDQSADEQRPALGRQIANPPTEAQNQHTEGGVDAGQHGLSSCFRQPPGSAGGDAPTLDGLGDGLGAHVGLEGAGDGVGVSVEDNGGL